MRLLEHQSRELLTQFGLQFSDYALVQSSKEAFREAEKIGAPCMLKVQVPFGGRAKAGGVQTADYADDMAHHAERMLGMNFRGMVVKTLSLERRLSFSREFYVGATWDTKSKTPVALLGAAGGVEVEQAGQQMVRRPFDPWRGVSAHEGREMASELEVSGRTLGALGQVLERLSRAFLDCDAVTVEINPLLELSDGELIGVDSHIEIDDDAGYRQHQRLESLGEIFTSTTGRPPTALEQEAQRIDSMDHRGVAGRVVEFDGDVALLIGGGGASLTVFDAILKYGGRPYNYCEIGGNPTPEKVAALTALLLRNPQVKKLAVIMNVVNNTRADVVAQGVLLGVQQAGRKAADVIALFRVPGSWEDEAHRLLASAAVPSRGREVSLDECAKLVVQGGDV